MTLLDAVLDQPLLYGGAIVAAALIVWGTWVGTKSLPPLGRWLARSLLLLAAGLPLLLTYIVPLDVPAGNTASAPDVPNEAADRTRSESPENGSGRRVTGRVSGRTTVERERRQLEPLRVDGQRPGSPTATDTRTRSAGGAAETGDWDVVPVFYGTDRAREVEQPARILYGASRAKRLEIGRALVTVPKVHEVPNIERPWVYRLPFTRIVIYEEAEDPKKHFTLRRVEALSEDRFLAIVRERLRASQDFKDHALVFVHGFNTSFDFALYRTAQMAYDLKFDGAPFVYSWPSQGKVLSYPNDREGAQQAQPYLRDFLSLVVEKTGARVVSLVAHSMGSQLLMPVLKDLKRTLPDGVRLSQVIWAAPDMDRDGFANFVREIEGISQGMTLYAHANDGALDISRKFWGGEPRAGDVHDVGPVIVSGLDSIDVSALSTDIFDMNHSGFAESKELIEDIRRLIKLGTRPPERRLSQMKRVETERGAYWRYQR